MKMLSLICCVLFCLGQSLASPSANQYFDTLIHTSLQSILQSEKLDPTHLPEYTFEYKDKTFLGHVKGKAEYSEGTLTGLSRVMRYSECDGPRNVSGATTVNCTLSFNKLETSYKGKVKYGVLPKVTIQAKGDVQNMILNVGIVKSQRDRNARVGTFGFRSVGSINTTFTGLGPLNKHMKVLEENYKQRVAAEVANVVNNRFQYALNLATANLPIPQH